jgi:two-component system LytT family response regulator
MMETIRALIVDDEPLAREGIRLLLEVDPEIEVAGECGAGGKAAAMIRDLRPDLLFLDVQMPEKNGFEVLSSLDSGRMPAVIFVTAYDKYALRAFEVQALDYLLKPFTDERFRAAVARAKGRIEGGRVNEVNKRMKALLESYRQRVTEAESTDRPRYLERLIVKSGGRVLFLAVGEIDWIEAADYYVQLHVGGKSHLLRETIASLEAQLDPNMFLRIHRSTLVNMDRVKEVKPHSHGNCQLILDDGTVLELSRRRRERLRSALNRLF